ncbi:MAG: amidohydrolase [Treponemataceae bacterium]
MSLISSVANFIQVHSSEYDALALDIWNHPEPTYSEVRSSAVHRERLKSSGFRVIEYPEMAYSFVAEKGSGKPVIAFMGEYDALPLMSQVAEAIKRPAVEGAPGHACGHNLLGVASLAAAEAAAAAMEEAGLPGTIRYYGCPAEEGLGRVNLVKAGRFNDADAAFSWHPADVNTPHRYATSAMLSLEFRFKGRASHAGMVPHAGRSALDAVQLMNLGIEFLREHVKPGTLLHYVITDGGAKANIVPETAAVSLYVRGAKAADVTATAKRVLKIARGAALMTETSFVHEVKHGKCDYIPNDALNDALYAAMLALPFPKPDAEENAFARALTRTVAKTDREASLSMIGAPISLLSKSQHLEVGDFGDGRRIGGSIDVGDVSYVVPVGQLNAATWPLGIGAHTWQSAAASGGTWALKAMRWAAASLACAGVAVAGDPKLLAKARAEHKKKSSPYRSPMDAV